MGKLHSRITSLQKANCIITKAEVSIGYISQVTDTLIGVCRIDTAGVILALRHLGIQRADVHDKGFG